MEKDSMDSKEKKTLNERLEISDYNGDSGLLGHELSFDGLFNAQEIDEVRKILGINQDEIGIVEIIRKMSKSLAEDRTSDYQKLGIDLHDHLTEYFLKGEGYLGYLERQKQKNNLDRSNIGCTRSDIFIIYSIFLS